MNYVIFSPGRSGSILIADELARLNPSYSRVFGEDVVQPANNFILHSHNPFIIVPNQSNTTAIICRRADHFAGAVSTLIAENNSDYSHYKPNTPITSFTVSRDKFIATLRYRQEFYQRLDLSNYAKVIEVWFDELVQDKHYLHNLLGITGEMQYTRTKSPYGGNNARFLIKNYNELVEIYQEIKHELC